MTLSDNEIKQIIDEFLNMTTERQYIGARYVPIFGRKDEDSILWDNTAPYEPLTIVLYQGNSYTSRQYVPTGVEITNEEFWAKTGNYNAQVEQYRQEVLRIGSLLPDTDFTPENTVKEYVDDVNYSRTRSFDTVQDMKNSDTLQDGLICITLGFYEIGDGGSAVYKISDTGTANEMDVIACGELYAHLVVDNFIYPEQIGAIETGAINITKFEHLFDLSNNIVFANDYDFNFVENSTVQAPTRILISNKDNITIDGNGHKVEMKGLTKSYLESINDISSSGRDIFSFLSFYGCENVTVKNIEFNGTNASDAVNNFRFESPRSICIAFKHCSNCFIENINGTNILGNVVNATTDDALTLGCSNIVTANCKAYNCYENGFNYMGGSTKCVFDNCISERCGGGYEAYGEKCVIQNCIAVNNFAAGILISGGACACNNKVFATTGNSDSKGAGIAVTGASSDISKKCKVIGNEVRDCNGYGFYLYPYLEDTIVKDNVFVNNGFDNTYKFAYNMTGTSTVKNKGTEIINNYFEINTEDIKIANIGNAENFKFIGNVFVKTVTNSDTYTFAVASTSSNYVVANNVMPKIVNKGSSTNYVIGNNVVGNTIPALQTDIS